MLRPGVSLRARATLLALAAPLAAQAESCGRFPSRGFENADAPELGARYANPVYGYAVQLPAGLVGHGAPGPAPDHGFGIALSWTPRAYLYVDGSYEVLDDDTLDKQETRQREFLRADALRVLSTQSLSTRLGPLSAVRMVARYACKGLRGLYVKDEVVALSPDLRVVYRVALLTTTKRYRADKAALDELLRSFTLLSRPVP